MNVNLVKTLAIVGGSILSIVSVGIIFKLVGSDDETLQATFLVLVAAGTAVDFYQRLSRRYLSGDTDTRSMERPQ